jgi:homeobox-leucine zipper protein
MARQYVRSVVGSVQRVAMAIAPSRPGTQLGPKPHPGSPEAHALARWISRSYIVESAASDAILKQLWQNSDAIMCCSVKTNASPKFTFANQGGLDMLETTLVALQDIMLDKVLGKVGRKILSLNSLR